MPQRGATRFNLRILKVVSILTPGLDTGDLALVIDDNITPPCRTLVVTICRGFGWNAGNARIAVAGVEVVDVGERVTHELTA